MRPVFARITGIVFIFTAILGIIFSLVAVIAVWRYTPVVTEDLQGTAHILGDALRTTSDGLVIMEDSLETSISSISTLESTVAATARSINDTTPMIDTLVLLSQEDLPNTITTTQLSLEAAQDSAEIIDGVLRFLANLPLVPSSLYNPPVPLHTALEQVSDSLNSVPPALLTIETSLTATGKNMDVIHADITLIAEDLREIAVSMEEARTVVLDYQIVVADLQVRVDRLETNLAGWIRSVSIILTFLLFWTAVAQIGLILQGAALLSSTSRTPEATEMG